MFDDLRKEGDASPFFEAGEIEPLLDSPRKKTGGLTIKSGGKFLGMTAVQRFILSFLLMAMVTMLGLMLVLVMGAINIPI
jgi:hypothetical protein